MTSVHRQAAPTPLSLLLTHASQDMSTVPGASEPTMRIPSIGLRASPSATTPPSAPFNMDAY